MTTPQWVNDCLYKEFSSGGHMGSDGQAWCNAAKRWMIDFLKENFGTEDVVYRRGHHEWSMFAKIGEQWWYFSSGDVRYNICASLLVRKATSPQDYTGGANMWVKYDVPNFEHSLKQLLEAGNMWTIVE